MTFTTYGSVRGDCGHRHRSLRTAARCLSADQRDCRAAPGGKSYSDRSVVVCEGDDIRGLTGSERQTLESLTGGAQ